MVRRTLTAVGAPLMAVVVAASLGGCADDTGPAPTAPPSSTPEAAPAAQAFAEELSGRISADAMMADLQRLQEIADAHGGNRAFDTPGYDASVDYVVQTLRDSGFDVQTPEFEVEVPFAEKPELTVAGRAVEAKPLEYTIGTPPPGVTGPLVVARSEASPGCTVEDYDGLPVQGAVVLVDRGECPFGVKQSVAAQRGAVALIVANNEDGDNWQATLGADTDVKIPSVGVTKVVGQGLRAEPGEVSLRLEAGVREGRTRNIIAQTKTGSTTDVVMAGAHLDSVPEGPGINDNGSGVAAVLETARRLGGSPEIRNAVRFAFWGAEELGVLGSANYIESLDAEQLGDIALYLNFDMVGSPNPGYFTLDGDQSAPPDPNTGIPRVPEGSAGIERTLAAYLDDAGKPAQDSAFDGRSDYGPFTSAGIPSGGLFSGAEVDKSVEQADVWGGEANRPFDPNYHKKTDTLNEIDRTSQEIHGRGAGFAVGLYAQDQRGRNGIPIREDRTRHPAGPS
ncbi:amidohydrolase [Mycobacterium sp. 852013-51886_SCH5428379]|uniref:M28 family metallopeptidase n=1 Tax=Mycobacterium sp. 852013-51886_SCH5428379 TaxID=1834111 RepID=UPI0007FBA1CB|nr:M28 family metallopeptidase [Mycobacterium sp. 852013-51886_SCH5428379]OBB58670.1 amidohydrolase [Mycobacterium sp. 852013-51886_SCH5428379]